MKSCIILLLFIYLNPLVESLLYPRQSISREVLRLDGIWKFRTDDLEHGFKNGWRLGNIPNVEPMAVPSSFNDITENKKLRDFLGWSWYETEFFLPKRYKEQRVFVRFGSANYLSVLWVNGHHLLNHTGGHLPFEGEITAIMNLGGKNTLVLALNNILTPTTIPQGLVERKNDSSRYPAGYEYQHLYFDYFHYAGIHRPVFLQITPNLRIKDISIKTSILDKTGFVEYSVEADNEMNSINEDYKCQVFVIDAHGIIVGESIGCSGIITVNNAKFWWPIMSNPKTEKPGYLYTLEVKVNNEVFEDFYRHPFGIRTVHMDNHSFFVNGVKIYFHGFGRHEDAHIRGRGWDAAEAVKDHELLKWLGANSYRTSHYPYAEETLDITDRLGFLIIDESPAIGLQGFGEELLQNHLSVMRELVKRDKNRPSVVMWSLGNEPNAQSSHAAKYFQRVTDETRMIDPSKRPITIVVAEHFYNYTAPTIDVMSINRYYGWYSDTGHLEVIRLQIPTEIKTWFNNYKRPILVTEYGAGSVPGLHKDPSFTWTEDYQVDYHIKHFAAFDELRRIAPYFIGEMIWNFADFSTPQETNRPENCMKGVLTRSRQPKRIAGFVRERYFSLAKSLNSEYSCTNKISPYVFTPLKNLVI